MPMKIEYKFSQWGPLFLETEIDKEFRDVLLEKGKASREKSLDHSKNLAAVIDNAYYYDDVGDWYFSRMQPYINLYLELLGNYMGDCLWLNTPHPSKFTRWELIQLWINFQKAKEYNPPHDHGGDLSFVIYLQVPDEIKEENERTKGEHRNEGAGIISFDYGQKAPFSICRQLRMPEEGKLLIFPAWLMHHVHAFESDVERISVSGNIWIKYD